MKVNIIPNHTKLLIFLNFKDLTNRIFFNSNLKYYKITLLFID